MPRKIKLPEVSPEDLVKQTMKEIGVGNKYLPEKEIDLTYVEAGVDVKKKSVSLKEMYGTLPKERLSAERVWNKVRPKGTPISKEKEPSKPSKDKFARKY